MAKSIVILGGGTAGWMTAAALTHFLRADSYTVTLVESELIGTIGVGEATIPHIRYFNNMLGIDESDFLREVSATYKLGIKFENWGSCGSSYIHPFGSHGFPIAGVDFHHYWLCASIAGMDVPSFDQFSLASVMAAEGKFSFPDEGDPLGSSFSYAYHIDAGKYAQFLRKFAEKKSLRRVEGQVVGIHRDSNTGDISSLELQGGHVIRGDLFIDCSGFGGVLLGKLMGVPFEDWSQWLLCDRAIAGPSEVQSAPDLFTRAVALPWGWRWCIPLQHRTGNGVVYSSMFVSDDEALDRLEREIGTPFLAEPNRITFKAGRRTKTWEGNCVAIGLSSGFLEPLESTSIYLIQQGILKLLEYIPDDLGKPSPVSQRAYNEEMMLEYERIRDFIILHYKLTSRNDSKFWNYCREMDVPSSLARKIELFEVSGLIERYSIGLFMQPSWLAVFLGQGGNFRAYDLRVSRMVNSSIELQLQGMTNYLNSYVGSLPKGREVLFKELHSHRGSMRPVTASLYGSM